MVDSYLLHRESIGPVELSLYALRPRFAYVGFRAFSSCRHDNRIFRDIFLQNPSY